MTTPRNPDWRAHEAHVQERLGLAAPSGSGNKFYDISDGVDRGHPTDGKFQLMVDCKATIHRSYRLDSQLLADWRTRATGWGRTFMLPVRFEAEDGSVEDWAVMHLDDLSALLDIVRATPEAPAPDRRPARVEDTLDALTSLVRRIPDLEARQPIYEAYELLAEAFPEVNP